MQEIMENVFLTHVVTLRPFDLVHLCPKVYW